MDPADLTATAARARIAAGSLAPAELAEACLARIASREPTVHALAFLDPALARRNAAAARPGALHGIPVGVKDVLDTADMPTEYNSPIWHGHRPRADAACVAWTRAAGGVVLAKTVTTEFATRQPGPTTNPHDPGHTPGGSSSGSAAGVAAGFFPVAFGTQTAGSIIRPAAYCGVVGYKPSYNLINRHGMKLMSFSLDTVGTLGRSVADCALLAAAAARADLGDPDRTLATAPRVGICHSPAWPYAGPETQALLEDAAHRLSRAGATVLGCELPSWFDTILEAQPMVMQAESAAAMGWELLDHGGELSAGLRERLEWGQSQPAPAVAAAAGALRDGQAAFGAVLGDLDVLLTPSAPGEAPAGLGWTGDPVFNALWTALHVPCVTVPAGTGSNGLPLGLQVVGRMGNDRAVLAVAQWIASALG